MAIMMCGIYTEEELYNEMKDAGELWPSDEEEEDEMKKQGNVTFLDWGKSMYGGYYANLHIEGKGHTGIGAETLKELREKLAEMGFTTKDAQRRDNI